MWRTALADRFVAPAARHVRSTAQRTFPHLVKYAPAAADRLFEGRLLSVVVPAYNVEDYIGECLESILQQTYLYLDVIVIVDGATDDTQAVAEEVAARDARVRVFVQPNGGLSAARNAGAARARGDFLWFVDSDDAVNPGAAAVMIGSLRETGSDFAVGSYRRFDSTRMRRPGSWILAAHNDYRPKTTAHRYPDILVNAVAWSKIYRRSFWVDNELSFPVGKLYEDQPVSARIYALATSIDVVPNVIYYWRDRDDGSSISQQSHELADLTARLGSAQASLESLREYGAPELAEERAVQLLSNDIQHSTKHLIDADDEFWQRLTDGIRAIVDGLPFERWRDVPAHHAALEYLLSNGDFDRARSYVEQGGQDSMVATTTWRDGEAVLCVPFFDDPDVVFPVEVIALSPSQQRPLVQLRSARWVDRGTLECGGWAYIPLLPQGVDDSVTATLISDESDPHTVPLPLETVTDPDIDRVSTHQLNDHRGSAFRGTVDVDALGLHPRATYVIAIDVTINGTPHRAMLATVSAWGSAGRSLPASTSPRGVTASMHRPSGKPVELRLHRARVVAEQITLVTGGGPGAAAGGVAIRLRSELPLVSVSITSLDAASVGVMAGLHTRRRVTAAVSKIDTDTYGVALRREQLAKLRTGHLEVLAIGADQKKHVIDWPDADGAPLDLAGLAAPAGLAFVRTKTGNLAMRGFPRTVHIETVANTDEAIIVVGRVIGNVMPTAVVVSDHRCRVEHPVSVDVASGRFEATIALTASTWGRMAPYATGRYEITFTAGEGTAGESRLETSLAESVGAMLPLCTGPQAPLVARLEQQPQTMDLSLIVDLTLTVDERGARRQAQFIAEHQTGNYTVDPHAVLFRTYYGENATGNALAIHQELRRRGANLQLYWVVKDSSIRVPDGAIPVIVDSRRFFELLSTARYLVDNVHQPAYFTKRPGQAFVQTLHGYPFKRAGLPYWQASGFGQSRIDSFLARHAQWDYLLSPAPYATPLLERDFPSDAQTLEIGYPRNDIFFAEEQHALRERTRTTLGIASGATAVLYAPTYRDNLSSTEFRSQMVDFLNLEHAVETLGENFVILIRGHAMNARVARRVGASASVIDVTDYPEITELCLASDAAVLDYSSLRFDYALTGKPMIFLVPDLAAYRDDVRGWMMPYDETAPGPFVDDTDEVAARLKDLSAVSREYRLAHQDFLQNYMPLEDGRASERLVDAVFDGDIFGADQAGADQAGGDGSGTVAFEGER